jgi:two-component system, LuxR family, sensor kinase FixL
MTQLVVNAGLSRWPKPWVAMVAVSLAVVVGWVDIAAGIGPSVTLFFLVPIWLSARYGGRAMGVTIALACSLSRLVALLFRDHSRYTPAVMAWNTATRSVIFTLLALLFSALSRSNAGLVELLLQRTAYLRDHEQRAEEMRNRLAAIVESTSDPIISNSLEDIIQTWNAGAEIVFGWPASEVVGKSMTLLVPQELQDEELTILERLKRGERIENLDTVRLRRDGSRIHVSLNITPLRDSSGKVIGSSKIVRDITERVQLEAARTEAAESEQARIARDLHDGLGQQLTGALFQSDLLWRDLAERSAAETTLAAQVHSLIVNALSQAREVSRGLYPVPPEPDGLMRALQSLADHAASSRQIECEFDTDSAVLLSDKMVATHLYRIAQKALNNALKHSGASRVEIKLGTTAHRLELTVRDYGTGLPKEGKKTGLGLQTMADRARLIGGQFSAQDAEDGGVRVTCSVRKPS